MIVLIRSLPELAKVRVVVGILSSRRVFSSSWIVCSVCFSMGVIISGEKGGEIMLATAEVLLCVLCYGGMLGSDDDGDDDDGDGG